MDYWSEGIGANQSVLRDHLYLRKNYEQGTTSFPSLINLNVYGSTARLNTKWNILNELLSLNPRKVSLSLVTPNQSTSNQNSLSSTLQAGCEGADTIEPEAKADTITSRIEVLFFSFWGRDIPPTNFT